MTMFNEGRGALDAMFIVRIQNKDGVVLVNDAIQHRLRNNEGLIETYGTSKLFQSISLGSDDSDDSWLETTVRSLIATLDVEKIDPLNVRQHTRVIQSENSVDVQTEHVVTYHASTNVTVRELSIDGCGRVVLRDELKNPKGYTMNATDTMTIFCNITHALLTPSTPHGLIFKDPLTNDFLPYSLFTHHLTVPKPPNGNGGTQNNLAVELIIDKDGWLHPNTLMNQSTVPISATVHRSGYGFVELKVTYKPIAATKLDAIVLHHLGLSAKLFMVFWDPVHLKAGESRDFYVKYEWSMRKYLDYLHPEVPTEPEVPTPPEVSRIMFKGAMTMDALVTGELEVIDSLGKKTIYSQSDELQKINLVDKSNTDANTDHVYLLSDRAVITIPEAYVDTQDTGFLDIEVGSTPTDITLMRSPKHMTVGKMINVPNLDKPVESQRLLSAEGFYLLGDGRIGGFSEGETIHESVYCKCGSFKQHTPIKVIDVPKFNLTLDTPSVKAGECVKLSVDYLNNDQREHYGDFEYKVENIGWVKEVDGYRAPLTANGTYLLDVLIQSESFDSVREQIGIDVEGLSIEFPDLGVFHQGEAGKYGLILHDDIQYRVIESVALEEGIVEITSTEDNVFVIHALNEGEVEVEIILHLVNSEQWLSVKRTITVKPKLTPHLYIASPIELSGGSVPIEITGVDTDLVDCKVTTENVLVASAIGQFLIPRRPGLSEVTLTVRTLWGSYKDKCIVEIL